MTKDMRDQLHVVDMILILVPERTHIVCSV
jgi:hypothetical protein